MGHKKLTIEEHSENKKELHRKWYRKNKERMQQWEKQYYLENKDKYRERALKYNYGISGNEYNKLFENQSGLCAICGRHQFELDKRLAVDHDHRTGEIRGLLCAQCNWKLGWLERYKEQVYDYLK